MRKLLFICFLIAFLFTVSGCSVDTYYNNSREISGDEHSWNLNSGEQSISDFEFTATVEFGGISTIWSYTAEADIELDISYYLSVDSGRAKLVLVDSNSDITDITINEDKSKNDEFESATIKLTVGENKIKLVSTDKAVLSFGLQCDAGDFKKLGF